MQVAKAIARDVLNASDSVLFESLTSFQNLKLLLEQIKKVMPGGLVTARYKVRVAE